MQIHFSVDDFTVTNIREGDDMTSISFLHKQAVFSAFPKSRKQTVHSAAKGIRLKWLYKKIKCLYIKRLKNGITQYRYEHKQAAEAATA